MKKLANYTKLTPEDYSYFIDKEIILNIIIKLFGHNNFKRIKKLHKVKLKNQWRLKTIILHFRRKRIIKTNIKTCLFYKI